jgi:hypothetical protein
LRKKKERYGRIGKSFKETTFSNHLVKLLCPKYYKYFVSGLVKIRKKQRRVFI